MGLVPRTIKEKNMQAFGKTLNWMVGFLFALMLSQTFGSTFVHRSFQLAFTLLCLVFYIIFTLPAPNNPNRRIWEGLVLWVMYAFSPRKYLSIIGFAFREAQYENRP